MSDLLWCVIGIIGSSAASLFISWLFSGRYTLVVDLVTVPSNQSKYSNREEIEYKKGFQSFDTYAVLRNHGNQSLQMSDFAPLNMPHILIVNGELQERKKPFFVLPNPDPSAMYNNVRLSYDGNGMINIIFDQLKAGQNIEIIVHTLVPDSYQGKIKLGVSATLKYGKIMSMKQLRATFGLIMMVVTAAALPLFTNLLMIPNTAKNISMIAMMIWWPLSVKLVDLVSYYSIRSKIISK